MIDGMNVVPLAEWPVAWRMVAVLLATATPASLATVVLSPRVRRAVHGPLTTLGMAALVWCAAAAGLALAASWGHLQPWADLLLAGQAVGGLVVFVYVNRTRWTHTAGTAPTDAADGAPHPAPRHAPGSLSFARGMAALGDRHYYVKQFAEHGPVFRMSQFGVPTLCVLGIERRRAILQLHGPHIGPAPLPFSRSVLRGFLRYMDDATHNHYGPLMRRAMLGTWSPELLGQLDALIQRHLAPTSAAAHHLRSGSATELVEPLVRAALDLTLFGFGEGDAAATRFHGDARAFYRVQSAQRLRAREEALLDTLVEQLREQEQRLHDRGEASTVPLGRVRALDTSGPDTTVLQNLVFMHRIATNNVSGLITWLLVYWAQHPEIVSEIRASSGEHRRFLLQRFLAETLRLSQSEYTYRTVTRRFVYEGIVYPAGSLLRFCVWESHRDADAFDTPEAFRLRLDTDAYAKPRFAPFGTGRHACNGADLNETLCVAILDALANGIDVAITHHEPLRRTSRHWGHWQPNPAMIVQLRHHHAS